MIHITMLSEIPYSNCLSAAAISHHEHLARVISAFCKYTTQLTELYQGCVDPISPNYLI